MKKRIISAALAFALCFALAIPALAVEFKDLKGHWAEEYMLDLVERKFLSGYEDGTMRPNESITASETLALLSHFYSPSSDELALITEDYGEYTKSVVPGSMQWAYDEIELCLASGIITKDELKTIELTKPIQKQRLALFLIRAIQKQSEAKALEGTTLSFADAASISGDCKGSIAKLAQLGIVKGDDANNFSPASGVARAVVATMISRTLDYLENNKITLVLTNYNGLVRTQGVIASATSGSLELRGYDGLVREYKFTSTASVTVNGAAKALSSSYVGCAAAISLQNGAVSSIAVTDETNNKLVQGIVTSISSSGRSGYLYITDSVTEKSVKYEVSASATVYMEGKEVYFSSITKKDFVTIKLEKNTVTEITAIDADKDSSLSGEITELKFGAMVSLKLMDSKGVTYTFGFDIASPPKILRGKTEISVDRLSVGNKVALTIENFKIDEISTEGSENTISGELTSITSTTSGTQWVIATSSGSVTLTLDKNAGVYSGKTAILLTDVHAGDSVQVVYYGSTITDVYLIRSTNSSSKLTGTVLAVNTSKEIITVLTTSDKIVYVDADSVSYIINAANGKSMTLSYLNDDSQIVAYGAYTDSTNFAAKLVVVEVYK